MNTAACAVSLVQEGIRNSERPLFADQLGMQETEHFMDTEPVEQDDVLPPFFDQFGMQRRQHFTDTDDVPPPLSIRPGRVHHFMAHSTVGVSVKQDVVRPTFFDELGGQGDIRTFAQANGMKTATRSTMQEGQALDPNPAELVLQPEISSPMNQEGQVLDVETARTLHSEIFSPLDPFDVFTCIAILRNLRQRSNQFLVEDGKLPVDEAGGDDR